MGKPQYSVVINSTNAYSNTSNVIVPVPNNTFTGASLTVSSFGTIEGFKNGTYTSSASSIYNGVYSQHNAFNAANTNGWVSNPSATTKYSTTNPYPYIGTTTTTFQNTTTTQGEYIQIQFPFSFVLRSFSLTQHSQWMYGNFVLCGSNTGGNDWVSLYNGVGTGASITTNYDINANNTSYSYYRIVISAANTNSSIVGIRYIAFNTYVNRYVVQYAIDWTFLPQKMFKMSYAFVSTNNSALTNNLILRLPDINVMNNNMAALSSAAAPPTSVIGIIPLNKFQHIYSSLCGSNPPIYCNAPANNIFSVVITNYDGTFPAFSDDYLLILYFEEIYQD